jgi:NitT/TauT family transport system substrate-binding protein
MTHEHHTDHDDIDPDVAASARELIGGAGWQDPSAKARTSGLSRREFMKESGLASPTPAVSAAATTGPRPRRSATSRSRTRRPC